MLKQFNEMNQGSEKIGRFANVDFNLASSIDEIFAQDSVPAMEHVLKGFEVTGRVSIWNGLAKAFGFEQTTAESILATALISGQYKGTINYDLDAETVKNAIGVPGVSEVGKLNVANGLQSFCGYENYLTSFKEIDWDDLVYDYMQTSESLEYSGLVAKLKESETLEDAADVYSEIVKACHEDY